MRGHGDHYYCRECYANILREEEREEENSPICMRVKSYNFKPSPVFLGSSKQNLYFGLEIEIDHNTGDCDQRQDLINCAIPSSTFYCKSDGSLNYGWEVVSHPGSYDYFAKECDWSWLDRAAAKGYRSYDTSTCGQHIHVSRAALSQLDIFKLLDFFRDNPNFILYISRRHGRQIGRLNSYAKTGGYPRAENQVAKMLGANFVAYAKRKASGIVMPPLKEIDIASLARYPAQNERYEAINLLNRHTVEFRIFRGTLKKSSILRNMAFLKTLIAYVHETARKSITLVGYRNWLERNAAVQVGKGDVAKSLIKWIGDYDLYGPPTIPQFATERIADPNDDCEVPEEMRENKVETREDNRPRRRRSRRSNYEPTPF